jgi:hypothetical protein
MNTRWFALGTVLTLLMLLQSSASAYRCDITVKINGGSTARYGEVNKLEIWIMNDVPLVGMALSFRTDWWFRYHWIEPYGNRPEWQPCVQEYGDAVGAFEWAFNFGDNNDNVTPDTMSLWCIGFTHPLPVHRVSTKLYDLAFYIEPWQPGMGSMMCVDNIASDPLSIEWVVVAEDDPFGIAPTFQGNPNADVWTADAPPVCFFVYKWLTYIWGDVDSSGSINIADVVYLVRFVFSGGPRPMPFDAIGDVNCDQTLNLADIVYLLAWLFSGGPPPC